MACLFILLLRYLNKIIHEVRFSSIYIFFPFMLSAFWKIFVYTGVIKIFYFTPRSFIFLSLSFRILLHLEYMFLNGRRQDLGFIRLHMVSQLTQHIYSTDCSLTSVQSTFVSALWWIYMGLFLDFYSIGLFINACTVFITIF